MGWPRFSAMALAGALAIAVAGCGRPGKEAGGEAAVAEVASAAYSGLRPCTLIGHDEAAEIAGKPFLRVMADNRVLGAVTACSYAVGRGGLEGLVQVNVVTSQDGLSADEHYDMRCNPVEGPRPAENPSFGPMCWAKSGLAVAKVGGVVLEASVQEGMGAVDAARTRALIHRVGPRLASAGD